MNAQNQKYSVTVALAEKDCNLFTEMACAMDVSRNVLMRRLVRYFLDGKISWEQLFKQSSDLALVKEQDIFKKKHMRAYLEPGQYTAFVQLTGEWGSTTSIVLRRIVQLYIAGKIEQGDIWQ